MDEKKQGGLSLRGDGVGSPEPLLLPLRPACFLLGKMQIAIFAKSPDRATVSEGLAPLSIGEPRNKPQGQSSRRRLTLLQKARGRVSGPPPAQKPIAAGCSKGVEATRPCRWDFCL
jgi:hypothetical protein